MGTDDHPVEWYLERAVSPAAEEAHAPGRGDWGRLSRDAFVANRSASARNLASRGNLRLSGVGVELNSAELSSVGALATAWQRAVSSTGAALELVKTLRGALPTDVVDRTALVLSASPQPGSIVLHLQPKAPPLAEVEPDGDVPMIDAPRPLADRASEQLILLLGRAASEDLADTDLLGDQLLSLGPRVGSALSTLALVIERTNITLGVSWAEPQTPVVSASVNPSQAKWITAFVAGRGLNAEEQQIRGVLRTVSDRERWLIELADEVVRMDASQLAPSVAAQWNVGAQVLLNVRVAQIQRPDGTVRSTMTILSVMDDESDESLS